MADYNLYYNVAWPLIAADSNRLGFVNPFRVPHACVITNRWGARYAAEL